MCNDLPRVERLTSFREPIPEGYFSKLDSLVSSRSWPPRHSNAVLSDVYREIDQIKFDLSDLERWRDRLLDAIAQGAIQDVSIITHYHYYYHPYHGNYSGKSFVFRKMAEESNWMKLRVSTYWEI